jgi:outer membrane protein TolC
VARAYIQTGAFTISLMTKLTPTPGRNTRMRVGVRGAAVVVAVLCAGFGAGFESSACAQSSGSSRQSGQGSSQSAGASSAGNQSAISAGQTELYNASGSNGAAVTDQSFRGSVIAGKNTGTVIPLSLDEAIQRGLRQNLGLILDQSQVRQAGGERLEQLQQLLPTITAASTITVEQVNLAAFGLKFTGLNPIIGPFQVVDFRAYLTQNLFNLAALDNYLASKHNFNATQLNAEDARDMVVLTVGNAYLVCVADQARIDAVNAELKTSRLTLDQAIAGHEAGTNPRLDVLRAQVDYQNEQQSLISTGNQLAKDKLALARVIGLPLDQQFSLPDTAPYKALNDVNPDTAFAEALKNRKDLQGGEEQVKAAETARKAAIADQYPTASFSGDFGDLGTTPGHSHGTYTATGQVEAPVLQIAKDRGERQVAEAALEQAKARLSDQVQQVNADIRSAILDIQSAAKLVQAAHSNVELAGEALNEAQQRFHVGVSDNLPVSQAQTQFEQANDQYISALYQHNVAKLELARAMGVAETNYKDYLGGK